MIWAPSPQKTPANQSCPPCRVSGSSVFNLIQAILALSLNMPVLFIKLGREVAFTDLRVRPLGSSQDRDRGVLHWVVVLPLNEPAHLLIRNLTSLDF